MFIHPYLAVKNYFRLRASTLIHCPILVKRFLLETFSYFFDLGLRHITDPHAHQYIVFILSLICVYQLTDFKTILLLLAAFALGLSITLGLATSGVLAVKAQWVAFAIPLTTILISIVNIVRGKRPSQMFGSYFFAVLFGLVHGLGLSNYLGSVMSSSSEQTTSLIGFNLGFLAGLLIIVLGILVLLILSSQVFRFKQRDWILVVSGACAGMSLILLQEAVFWK